MHYPLIIAHRALTPGGLENSATSIQMAAESGADLIELDVRLTLDLQPVILHDALLGRTTTWRGPIRVIPSPLLRRIDVRDSVEPDRIPLLRDVLRIAPATAQLALHLKSRGAIGPVLRELRKHGEPGRTWLWLERMDDVYRATRAFPELRCTLLRPGAWTPGRRDEYFHDAQAAGARAVSVPPGAVSPSLVHHAHQHHLFVFSRIDDVGLLPELVENGLDGAITTDPAGAITLLRESGTHE